MPGCFIEKRKSERHRRPRMYEGMIVLIVQQITSKGEGRG